MNTSDSNELQADALFSPSEAMVASEPVKAGDAPLSAADAPEDNATTLWLHAGASSEMTGNRETSHMGQPVMHAWADALICGNYTHPVTGQSFSIDRDRLDRCVSTFHALKANGFSPPCVDDHKETAANSNGSVIDAKRDGDRLMLLHRFVGEDSIRKASRNLVSVKLCSTFKDSKGNVYRDAITHSALTPCPVIPNQRGFSIAASRSAAPNAGTSSAPVYLLAAPPTLTRSNDMFSPEQVERIKKLPGAANVTDDGAAEFLLSYAEATAENVVALAEEKNVLLSRVETAETKSLELSRVADPFAHLDPEALVDRADLVLGRIDLAMERGDIPKAIADKIKGKVKGANGTPNAMLLSRAEALDARPVDFILSLFDGAKLAPKTGEVTQAQTVELSRATPGSDGSAVSDVNPLLVTAQQMNPARK